MGSLYEEPILAWAISAITDAATDGVNASFSPIMPVKGTISKVVFVPSAAVVANATNFRTLSVRNKGTNGLAGTTIVATRAWSAVNSALSTPESLALSGTPANLAVQAGDVFDLNQTHGGTGLIIPAGSWQIWIRPAR